MMVTLNNRYGYAVALAVISFLLSEWLIEDEYAPRLSSNHSADFFSSHYEKWQMSDTGERQNYLFANKMTHFSDNGVTLLEQPQMSFYSTTQPTWQLKAQTGDVSKNGESVSLNGQVNIERLANAAQQALIIETRNLTVSPKTFDAKTSELTKLHQGNNTTTGLGMTVNFKTPVHLELLANVHSKYEPKP
jgi:LPS export ABC transporter protein LptC